MSKKYTFIEKLSIIFILCKIKLQKNTFFDSKFALEPN